jgi:hypothetical protein
MKTRISPAALHRQQRFEADELHTLLKTAESAGIRIVITRKAERHIAIDPLSPCAYEVSRKGCECARFGITGKCEHHALLMSELGEIEDPGAIGWPDDPPITLMAAD